MRSATIVAMALLGSLLRSLPARGDDGVVVAGGDGLEFAGAQIDASGLRGVVARRRIADLAPPAPVCATRVVDGKLVTLDLTAPCGSEVLREVYPEIYPGGMFDPSITADGTGFAWRQASSPPGETEFWFGALDLGTATQVAPNDTTPSISSLEIAPSGSRLVYWRSAGGVQQVARRPVSAASPIEVVDSGAALSLNDVHCVDSSAKVFYTKLVGAEKQVLMSAVGQTPVQLSLGAGDKTLACVSQTGAVLACVRRIGNVDNIIVSNTAGPPVVVQLTNITSPSVEITSLDISADGGTIAFASNGDFAGENPDGLDQVFRMPSAPGGPITQVTDFGLVGQQRPHVAGVSISGDGRVLLAAIGQFLSMSGEACEAADFHSIKVRYYSLDMTPPTSAPSGTIVLPPFDVVGEAFGPPLGCATTGDVATCLSLVRGSKEGPRNVLIIPEWTITSAGCERVIRRQPTPMVLPAEQTVSFTDSLTLPPPCLTASGSFRLIVVSPDVASADRASAVSAFSIP